jgi:hypothetical protein
MNTYVWDTEIGMAIAVASSVNNARCQILETLDPNDQARPELEAALQSEPRVVGNESFACMAWH